MTQHASTHAPSRGGGRCRCHGRRCCRRRRCVRPRQSLRDLTAGRSDAGTSIETGVVDSAAVHPRVRAGAPRQHRMHRAFPSLIFAFDFRPLRHGQAGRRPPQAAWASTSTKDVHVRRPEARRGSRASLPTRAGRSALCDGVDGRDNAAGPLLSAASVAGKGIGPAAFQKKEINSGASSTLLDDARRLERPARQSRTIVVGYAPLERPRGLAERREHAPAGLPKFDGSDVWTVAPASVLGGERARRHRLSPSSRRSCVPLQASTLRPTCATA